MELQLYRAPTVEQPAAVLFVQSRFTDCAAAVVVMQYVVLHTTVGVELLGLMQLFVSMPTDAVQR
jgi:hypothetical protein